MLMIHDLRRKGFVILPQDNDMFSVYIPKVGYLTKPLTLDEILQLYLNKVFDAVHGVLKRGTYYSDNRVLEFMYTKYTKKRLRFVVNDLLSHMVKVIYNVFIFNFYEKIF